MVSYEISLIREIILQLEWISQSETSITSEYKSLSYNLSELANQNQALHQNTSRYFIPKMSVFNTSKVLCNSHVMFVYACLFATLFGFNVVFKHLRSYHDGACL